MYKLQYDYVKPKNDEKPKLCYMNTSSLIFYVKTNEIYRDIAEDVETRTGTSNYDQTDHYERGKIKK